MAKELLNIGAAYVRVSDERQGEYSPASQIKMIREYAARDGYQIPDHYVFYDDGISGKSAKKRDAFNEMIAHAKDKTHPFDAIFVWKFSRFARNQEEAMVYKNLLKKHQVSVVSVSEPIPEGHYGSLIERIIEWMDEFYLTNLSTEVTRGMSEKIARGEPTAPPPFGYVMRDKMFFPDEDGPADIVREVYQRYADGEGQRDIAVSLGERGIRTKWGNLPDNRYVDYMLNNPCYIGKLRRSTGGSRSVSKRDYHNDNVLIVDGHHSPIIPLELWERVQMRLEEQKRAYPKYAKKGQPVEHMLKGLVRCSSCGGTLAINGWSGKNSRNLQCCNYSKGLCTVSHSIAQHKIEEAVIAGLEQALGAKQFTIVPKQNKKADTDTVDYDKLIAVEERKLARAKEAYLAEIDSLEQYKENKTEIAKRIEALMKKRDDRTVMSFDVAAYTNKVAGIVDFLKSDDVTPKAKNEALRAIVEKVVYDKAKQNVAIYFYAL